jgi:hypothetical protein
MVKSDGFLSPPPLLMTCFITTNVPSCGLLSEVSFDESDDEESDDDEAEDEDVFTSITSLDFLSSSPSDIRDEVKDDNDDIFLLLSWDSAYEFKSTKVDKANTVTIIKRIKHKANPGVIFGNNILLLLLDYIP